MINCLRKWIADKKLDPKSDQAKAVNLKCELIANTVLTLGGQSLSGSLHWPSDDQMWAPSVPDVPRAFVVEPRICQN